ncbi:hypothetical protein BGW42_002530 [Actinomortierella wolfii]|nr:hypothetical protein BGW42_002530 [Actinomortierella wolfii]
MSSVTFVKKNRRNIRRREKTPEDEGSVKGSDNTAPSSSADEASAAAQTPKSESKDDNHSEGEADKDLSLEELIELRKLRQKKAGVAAEELLVGDTTLKKKKKDKTPVADPWKLSSGGGLVDLDEVRRSEDGAPRSTTLNSFTKQTNALDVDKHMMKYIEEELKKRKGIATADNDDDDNGASNTLSGDIEILNQLGIRQKAPKPEQEGNVQLSTTMLTAIPEVDLGISERLRNIEETERAKRKLFEENKNPTQANPGGNRFRAPAQVLSDHERTSRHRDLQSNPPIPNTRFQTHHMHQKGAARGMATDDIVMERFKKRMRR